MRTEYGRLVRDKIPAMIREHGAVPLVRELSPEEFSRELNKRLIEEAWDVYSANDAKLVEECADVFEVISWIMRARGIDTDDVFAMLEARRAERGGFEDRVFLIAVEEATPVAQA